MATSSLIIRDVVHGDIPLTSLEREIIETCEFQRLRNINQTSLNFLVYPSMRHSRFEHSLGVMHLSGSILESLFSNAQLSLNLETSLTNFLSAVRRDILDIEEEVCSYKLLRKIITQAVRLAGLLHDVGHLPFSHLFEDAVAGSISKQFEPEAVPGFENHKSKLHERIGTWLIFNSESEINNIIVRADQEYLSQMQLSNRRGPLTTLLKALFEENHESPMFALRLIYSSNFDADRLDYIRRDGMLSGTMFGYVDVQRIVSSFILLDLDVLNMPEGAREEYPFKFSIMPGAKSLSTLEALIHERVRMFRWVNFHQATSGFASAMEYALFDLFMILYRNRREVQTSSTGPGGQVEAEPTTANPYEAIDNAVLSCLDVKHYQASNLVSKVEGRICDDIDFLGRLRKIYGQMKQNHMQIKDDFTYTRLFKALHQVIFREICFKPLWKKITSYKEWHDKSHTKIQEAFHFAAGQHNGVHNARNIIHKSKTKLFNDNIGNFLSWFISRMPPDANSNFIISSIANSKHNMNVLIKTHGLSAFNDKDREINSMVDIKENELRIRKLIDISEQFRHFDVIWESGIHFFAYVLDADEDRARLQEKLTDTLVHWIENGCVDKVPPENNREWFKEVCSVLKSN